LSAAKSKRVRVRPYRTVTHGDDQHPAGSVLSLPATDADTLIAEGYVDLDVDVPEPLEVYDDLEIDEVLKQMRLGTPELVEHIKAYERRREHPRRQILGYEPYERVVERGSSLSLKSDGLGQGV
jgi:hypothetical protein